MSAASDRTVPVRRLGDDGNDGDYRQMTAEERLACMRELAVTAWAFNGERSLSPDFRDMLFILKGGYMTFSAADQISMRLKTGSALGSG